MNMNKMIKMNSFIWKFVYAWLSDDLSRAKQNKSKTKQNKTMVANKSNQEMQNVFNSNQITMMVCIREISNGLSAQCLPSNFIAWINNRGLVLFFPQKFWKKSDWLDHACLKSWILRGNENQRSDYKNNKMPLCCEKVSMYCLNFEMPK
jgi:hypothetical protein